MTSLQAALLAKADRALTSARRTLDDYPEMAANRAYYACYYIAQAALAGVDEQPRTHSGTHNRFALRFVVTGLIAPEVARTLPYAAQIRERADYDAFALVDARAASDLLDDAERFVSVVRGIVEAAT